VELVRLAATRARSIVAPFFSATAKAVRYSATEPGRAGIPRQSLLAAPGRERNEIVGVGPLGVLGTRGAGVGRGGIRKLATLRRDSRARARFGGVGAECGGGGASSTSSACGSERVHLSLLTLGQEDASRGHTSAVSSVGHALTSAVQARRVANTGPRTTAAGCKIDLLGSYGACAVSI
jgi:hypothetical protein